MDGMNAGGLLGGLMAQQAAKQQALFREMDARITGDAPKTNPSKTNPSDDMGTKLKAAWNNLFSSKSPAPAAANAYPTAFTQGYNGGQMFQSNDGAYGPIMTPDLKYGRQTPCGTQIEFLNPRDRH